MAVENGFTNLSQSEINAIIAKWGFGGPSATVKPTSGTSRNDVLTGTESNDTLYGYAGNDTLDGKGGRDKLNGGSGSDLITGGAGGDTFEYSALNESRLDYIDSIRDLLIGTDSIDSLYPVTKGSIVRTVSGSSLKVTALTESSIQKTLTASVFSAKGAAVFTYTSSGKTQTFLALNDTRAGFQSTSDALINITGYSGSLANLAIV